MVKLLLIKYIPGLTLSLVNTPRSGAASGDTSVSGVLTHQMRQLWSRDPTGAEIKDVENAFATCSGPECSNNGLANGVCVALAGANEILFY